MNRLDLVFLNLLIISRARALLDWGKIWILNQRKIDSLIVLDWLCHGSLVIPQRFSTIFKRINLFNSLFVVLCNWCVILRFWDKSMFMEKESKKSWSKWFWKFAFKQKKKKQHSIIFYLKKNVLKVCWMCEYPDRLKEKIEMLCLRWKINCGILYRYLINFHVFACVRLTSRPIPSSLFICLLVHLLFNIYNIQKLKQKQSLIYKILWIFQLWVNW